MKKKKLIIYIMLAVIVTVILLFVFQPSFGFFGIHKDSSYNTESKSEVVCNLVFNADSAYTYCSKQCDFGARTMNSEAHDKCGEWIKVKFAELGCSVESQKANLKGYDGTTLRSENIIAHYNPEAKSRILICAHWDSRPWADNDPDKKNHHTPVMAANDGASGVAVMLELARMLKADTAGVNVGVDFICFDAEDYGTPQWAGVQDDPDTWALGAQYWSKKFSENAASIDYSYQYGILLDMVGGEGAKFYQEGFSMRYASDVVNKVWKSAATVGYGSFFVENAGGSITDDHIPVNEIAGIKCIDIIPYYPDCEQSSFGPTWHTVNDTMDHISVSTLKAVGQSLAQVLCGL